MKNNIKKIKFIAIIAIFILCVCAVSIALVNNNNYLLTQSDLLDNNEIVADINNIATSRELLKSSIKVLNNIVEYIGSDRKYSADIKYIDNIGIGEKSNFYIDFLQTRLNCGWVTHVALKLTFTLTTPNGTKYYKSIDHTFKGNDDNQSCRLFDSSVLHEDGVYTVSMSGSVTGGTTVGQSNSFTFRYDNTAPLATLQGVQNNGVTNTNVSAVTSIENTMRLYRTSPSVQEWDYSSWLISEEGSYRLEVSDGINQTNYYFIIDKTAPVGTLDGVPEGGTTGGSVTFTWVEKGATATLDGKPYTSGKVISSNGWHTIILKDEVGNERTYKFCIDATRPYVVNAETVAEWFDLSKSNLDAILAGQIGDADINLGVQAPGVEIKFADSYSSITVEGNFKPYTYDSFGNITIGSEQTITYSESSQFNKSGEYILTVTDAYKHKLTLRFILKVSPILNNKAYVEKVPFLIFHDENADNILGISEKDYQNGLKINYLINGVDGSIDNYILSSKKLQQIINNCGFDIAQVCLIRIGSIHTDEEYFSKLFACSFNAPKIKNESELKGIFKGSNKNYWGVTQSEFSLETSVNIFELDITARLEQTLLAYDSRNVLYAKESQNVEYISGSKIANNGYYKLTLEDSIGRITVIKFSRIKEFKSANEYALKNDYYIAPNYISVKLPVAFGNFEIQTIERIKNRYIGNFTAEKSYLFENFNNAADFAFAAEYNVCVQKTASGYLYRAGNQGIQVAYNSFEKLTEKIRQVIKAYLSEKSYEISDKPYIDYTSTVIMDDTIKYNACYRNIAKLTYNSIVYDKVLMADNAYYLRLNSINAFGELNSAITITHIDTGNTWVTNKNSEFGLITGGANGLYRITEQCPGGDENFTLSYYVYIDNIAPVANITSIKASGRSENNTVTVGDTIVIQAAEFRLNSVIDSTDLYCMIKIMGYGFDKVISAVKDEASDIVIAASFGHKGLYKVEIYDRAKNRFAFEVYIMSKEPEASFTKNGSGDSEYVTLTITLPDKFCTVMDLRIARNKTDENDGVLSTDSDNTSISPAVLTYVFRKGGRYTVVIKDNYERITIVELRYVKDMPEITADGLNKARRVNGDVIISIPLNAEFTVTAQYNSQFKYNALSDSTQGKQIITISPRNEYNEIVEIEDTIIIKAWYESDPDAYNDLSYILDTIAPNIEILNEDNNGLGGTIFSEAIKFSYDGDVKEFKVTRGGKYYSYIAGQLIRNDGVYEATATDLAGNIKVKEVVVDMQVSYAIAYGNNKQHLSNFESIDGVNALVVKSFKITAQEQIIITATKNGYEFDYMLGDTVTTSGLYVIKMQDNVGNKITLVIRVLASISDIAVYTESDKLIGYNTRTNESIRIEYGELSYIKKIEYRRGLTYSTYLKGEYLTIAGKNDFFCEDAVGNELTFSIMIDKQIDMTINFDKSHVLNDDSTLTTRFKIILSEIGAVCSLKCNGESIEFQSNTWYNANGVYEYDASDSVGNVATGRIRVVGETLPSVTVTDSHGDNVNENAIINRSFFIAWSDSDYISTVKVNGEIINNGSKFERDGKYNVEVFDLLERTKIFFITLVTNVDYSINYKGIYEITEGDKLITLTRGFSIMSNGALIIKAELNGYAVTVNLWKTYNAVGDWKIILEDIARNSVTIHIRVRDRAFIPKLVDTDGKELLSGVTTNKGVSILYDEYISEITVDGIRYIKGEYISNSGKHTINIVDCIGNTAVMKFVSDFAVDCTINYGKNFKKVDCILTNRFSITLNELAEIKILFNDENIELIDGYYLATGKYTVAVTDEVGNWAMFLIEVDNRLPEIDIINAHGEIIMDNIINNDFIVSWNDSMNIGEVKINGITVENGTLITQSGKHTIEITNLLGVSAVKNIEIRREVLYELSLGKVYRYSVDNNTIILTDKFSISGKDITIECITEFDNIMLKSGQIYSTDGLCSVVIQDSTGNTETLYFNVTTKAIGGEAKIDNQLHDQNISTNKSFSIEFDDLVKTAFVDGKDYISGSIVSKEGKHVIDYVDVLDRKSEQIVIIDLTVELEIEYSNSIIFDNINTLLAKKLVLIAGEELDIRVWRDGVEIFDFYGSTIDGTYEILATDNVGNLLFKLLIIDNTPPLIEVSDPDSNNAVSIKVSDKTQIVVDVYKKQELWLSGITEFVIDENGNFTVRATDALGNYAEMKISTDMEVEVTTNFLNGQSVNFRPKFTVNEEISYSLALNGVTVEYKLNDELIEKGEYTIWFTDKQNNALIMNFIYIGNSKKQQICDWQLPDRYDGYVVRLDGISLDIESDESGRLRLHMDGLYDIEINVDGKIYQYSVRIIATPPKITLSGVGTELKTKDKVNILSTSDYIVYHNGIELGKPSTVTEPGKYKIVATDEVGNVKILEFEIQYSLNPSSILLVIMTSIISLIAFILIIRYIANRKKVKNQN